MDTVQQLADWLSDVLVGGKDVSESLRVNDSDQHGEIDPPVDAMDRSDSLALLLKNAINLISTVLNGTEAQVTAVYQNLPGGFSGCAARDWVVKTGRTLTRLQGLTPGYVVTDATLQPSTSNLEIFNTPTCWDLQPYASS